MTLFRGPTVALDESMDFAWYVKDEKALRDHLQLKPEQVLTLEKGPCIGWATHRVLVDGKAVGFTNGKLK